MVSNLKKMFLAWFLMAGLIPMAAFGEQDGQSTASPSRPSACPEKRARMFSSNWEKAARIISYTYDVGNRELELDRRIPELPFDSDACICIVIQVVNNPEQKEHRYILKVENTQVDSASDVGGQTEVQLLLRPVASVYFNDPKVNYKIVIKELPASSAAPTPEEKTLSQDLEFQNLVQVQDRVNYDFRLGFIYHDAIENRHADGAFLLKVYFLPSNEENKKHYYLAGPGWRNSWMNAGFEVGGSLQLSQELVYVGLSYPLWKYLDFSAGAAAHILEERNNQVEWKSYVGLNTDLSLTIYYLINKGGGLLEPPTP